MKYIIILGALALALILTGSKNSGNPFVSEWDTPFGVPPFDEIKIEHYTPAFDEALKLHTEEIEAIATQQADPTFANTIEVMDRSGAMLSKVSNVFFSLNSSMTNDDMQAIARDVAPRLSAHQDEINLDERLFKRVKAIYANMDKLDLNVEQKKLLDEYYKGFVRGGANLESDKKEEFKKINEQLSVLSLQFGENVLAENNAFELVIDNEADLAGLPDASIEGAAEAAVERGHDGKWVFTLHKPSMIPFLQYAENRALREKIYKAYYNRGNNGDEYDNKAIVSEMATLRLERSQLLGYKTYAHYVLEENMAKEPDNVYKLLNELWTPALERAKTEVTDMQKMIDAEGGGFELQTWDWWYYAEKVKKEKYDLDEEMLRPYFLLENVRAGAFEVATMLFGLQFEERTDLPKYHEDVSVIEVKEADGAHVAILYVDYFPRASKRGGAWMGELRQQSRTADGKMITPVIYNVGNFSKPTADKPSLLSFDEVNTLFHEFGHALHGLLSDCTYEMLAGTNVARDFVELPSQIMENWASEPEVMKMYARHYKTGDPMPDELMEKIRKAKHFNQGFGTTEYLAASFLDMDWHTLAKPAQTDVLAYEDECLNKIGLIPEIISRYRSPYFRHIFAGGYAAGYYAYVWAEVLDADAFQAFKETGNVFDKKTATAFREFILSKGGTEDPMTLYVRFRGKEPTIEPLLSRRGLN
jgi:peptidyl-dipeptidase Dcp